MLVKGKLRDLKTGWERGSKERGEWERERKQSKREALTKNEVRERGMVRKWGEREREDGKKKR